MIPIQKCCSEPDFYYYPDTNEEGWKCVSCGNRPGEPAGYCPQLDQVEIESKVYGILLDLHEHEMFYVSNGMGGMALAKAIAERCKELGRFDQYTIISLIFQADRERHAEYWQKIGDGVRSGNDTRDRCACGKLATAYIGKQDYCSEHSRAAMTGELLAA